MTEHWNGGNGGKGCKPRPFNISDEEFGENMKRIFGDKTEEKERKAREKAEYFAKLNAETKAKIDNTGTTSNEYYDVLSTEDCFEPDDKLTRYNDETQQVLGVKSYRKEI